MGGIGLNVRAVRTPKADILSVTGEIDIVSASELLQAVSKLETSSPDRAIVVDLSEVEYMDLAGVRILEEVQHRVPERLILVASRPMVHSLLEMVHLGRRVTMSASLEEALKALVERAPPLGHHER